MRIALDTNCYGDFRLGDGAALAALESAEQVWLPFIVVAELRAGYAGGHRKTENERILGDFLLEPQVGVLYPDDQTTHHSAAIFRQLRGQGRPIPTNDMWIAALVVPHGLALLTRDAHFQALPQLVLI